MTMDGWVGLTMICVSQAPCPYLGRQSILYACVLLYSVHTTANKPLDQNHFPSPREESHPVRQPRQPTPPTGTNKRKGLLIHMPYHDHACFTLPAHQPRSVFLVPTPPSQNKTNTTKNTETYSPNHETTYLTSGSNSPLNSTQHASQQQQHTPPQQQPPRQQ